MQRMNSYTGVVIVPLLARLILCAAFLTAGWNKLMNTQEFTGEPARTLIDRGFVEETPASVPVTPASQDAGPEDDNLGESLPSPPQDVVVEDPQTGENIVIAKRLHTVTLALLDRDVDGRWASIMAWGLAIVELVGGALLLIGLFSRLWAIGIVAIMVGAFYVTSVQAFLDLGPFGVAADMRGGYALFHQVYAQLGLLALALAVVLTGPGPLSLDRLLFRSSRPHDPDADLPD